MGFKHGFKVILTGFLFVGRCFGADADAKKLGLTDAEARQWSRFSAEGSYCHHIIAVDNNGNALLPIVTCNREAKEGHRYRVATEKLAGEDTVGADFMATAGNLDSTDGIRQAVAMEGPIRNVMQGRKMLYLYLDEMFKAIAREQPDEVVVHIHGGLNSINGAIEKTARISDELGAAHAESGRRIFYIGICWNSALGTTYLEHLYPVREGLRQPEKALVTLPAMLLSDIGSAAARLPLDLINFLFQDAYTVRPSAFKRTRLAQTRVDQILHRQTQNAPGGSLASSRATDQRTSADRKKDAALWLLTQPIKIPSTFLLDWLGTEPWKNMLRRTRTMFERESEFIPNIDYCTAARVAGTRPSPPGGTDSADVLLDQMNATGRLGAVALFCEQAQGRLIGAKKRPKITLIGHSMGAIVASEILERFHRLTLDNVVFMAAACSISDLKAKVVPFLQEQNLREQLGAGAPENWQSKLAGALREQGLDPAAIADVQRQCGAPASGPAVTKTRFYSLCLHDAAENGEKFQALPDFPQRGSLLTWIDILYQKPESENDRTLGRWVNAILATDSLPADVVDRITIKEFGRDRAAKDFTPPQPYVYKPARSQPGSGEELQEPTHHGDFGRFEAGPEKETTNFAFWREVYRFCEDQNSFLTPCTSEPGIQVGSAGPHARKTASRAARKPRAVAVTPIKPAAVAAPAALESAKEREARTGF